MNHLSHASVRPTSRALLLVGALILTPCAHLIAQTPTPTPTPAQPYSCNAPTFGVTWADSDSPQLVVKADPEADYEIGITVAPYNTKPSVGTPTPTPNPSSSPSTVIECPDGACHATPTGLTYSINLYGFKLIEAGGRIRVSYKLKANSQGQSSAVAQCGARDKGYADIIALEKHRLRIYAGAVFALQANGSFATKPEFAINASSQYKQGWTGIVDLRYDYIAAVQSGSASVTPTPPASSTVNPFASGGGTFDASISTLAYPWSKEQWSLPWFTAVGGLGVRTQPATDATSVTARGRVFIGGRLQVVGYNQGEPADSFANTQGYFQLAYAYDKFWQFTCPSPTTPPASAESCQSVNSPNRLVASGQLEIPGVGSKSVRIVAAARLDWPIGGATGASNPTDFSVSILSAISPSFFQTILGGGSGK